MLPKSVVYTGHDSVTSENTGIKTRILFFKAKLSNHASRTYRFIVNEDYTRILNVRIDATEESKSRSVKQRLWMSKVFETWRGEFAKYQNLDAMPPEKYKLQETDTDSVNYLLQGPKKKLTFDEIRALGNMLLNQLGEEFDFDVPEQLKYYIVSVADLTCKLQDALMAYIECKFFEAGDPERSVWLALDKLANIARLITLTFTLFLCPSTGSHVATWLNYFFLEIKPSLLKLYTQNPASEELTGGIDKIMTIARRFTADTLTPESPDSYFHLTKEYLSNMDKSKALLIDYTKNNSKWCRFWTGHWNRHHLKAVQSIVDRLENNHPEAITDLEKLMDELDKINPENNKGSLAKRMKFIRQLSYVSKYNFEMAEPEEGYQIFSC